ncbi:MAG: 3D domain-containing protein [Eubacterium sp.]
MNKTRLITGVLLLIASIAIAVVVSADVISTFSEQKLTKENMAVLKAADVETVLKSANVATVLTESAFGTNTEDSLPTQNKVDENNSSIIIESNDSVKITKKKSKKKNKKKKNKKSKSKYLGTFKVTGYCSCSRCCGKSTGITASGTVAKAGRTIAADTSKLSFGTKVVINGHTYTVEDKGGAISGNRIDIFFSSHAKALQWGVRYCKVYVPK